MGAPGLTIPTSFTAKGDYVTQVNRMSNATDKMIGSLSRLNAVGKGAGLSDITKNVLSYAKSALLVGGAFATARFSANSITEYETAIQSLQAVTGSGEGQMVGFKKQIEELGVTSKKSMIDVAKSFETVGSMMSQYLDDPKALRMITESGITLSKASRMELEPALQSLTSVMNQFQLSATDANKTIQTLTAGEIVGAIRTSEASQYLQEFGAVAKNMGVNVGESVALIEALGIQMDKSKIGVGARNILTAIGAAGGLDRKARQDMRAAGVDMNYLMDTSNTLSERLHELSKISKDPVKMISVFGKENVTAANVIFNQLGTYDKFYDRIQNTSEAENQAATNSKTFAVALDQLKNRWSNLLNTSSSVGSVLDKFRNTLFYVGDNMESIVSVGAKLIGGFLAWKAAIMLTQGALIGFRAVSQAFFLVDMVKYVAVTKGITTATAAYEVVMASLNGTMLLNPAFLVVAGLTALIGVTAMAINKSEELRKEYAARIELQMSDENDKEIASVKRLALEYYNMGQSIKSATENAIKFKLVGISEKRFKIENEISSLKKQLSEEKNKIYLADLFYGGGTPEVGARSDIAEKLASKQREAALLAQDAATAVGFAKSEQDAGIIGGMNVGKYIQPFEGTSGQENKSFQGYGSFEGMNFSEQRKNLISKPKTQEDFDRARKMEITIKNEGGSQVDVKSGKTSAKSVMPNTKSSFSTN